LIDQSQEFPEETRAARRARRRSGGSKTVPPMSREARAEARKKAELAKYEEERQRAREERVETLSNNLIRKLSILTDTKMKAPDIRRFQRSIQVPRFIMSLFIFYNGDTNYAFLPQSRERLNLLNSNHLASTFCILLVIFINPEATPSSIIQSL
jgi:hypothetical protein